MDHSAPKTGPSIGPAGDDPGPIAAHGWMDAIRYLAAVVVVVGHARDLVLQDYPGDVLWAPLYAITGLGHQAVIVFFVISGYWITHSTMRRLQGARFWPEYGADRLARLWTVLLPALALTAMLDLAGSALFGAPYYTGASGAWSMQVPVAERLGLVTLLGNIAFLQGFAVSTYGSNGPLWSLAFEFWFYIIFPAVILLLARRKVTLPLLSLGLLFVFPGLATGMLAWLMGSALWFCARRVPRPPHWANFAALPAFAMLPFGGAALAASQVSHPAWDIATAVTCALFLLTLLWRNHTLSPPPPRLARAGSQGSYSLYAVHFPVLALAAAATGAAMGAAERLPASPTGLAVFVALTIVALLAGALFARLFEARSPDVRAAMRAIVARFAWHPAAGRV